MYAYVRMYTYTCLYIMPPLIKYEVERNDWLNLNKSVLDN
jgi:hypothetical protein